MNQKQGFNNQRSQRGRPKNSEVISVIHPQRQQKAQQIKEYWTEHRITLIAYQAQYIFNKKQIQGQDQTDKKQKQKKQQVESEGKKEASQERPSKRKGRKKTDPQFQTGFLFSKSKDQDQSVQQYKVQELVKTYPNLSLLFSQSNKDLDDIELRQFMKIMLQLKNQQIIHQFLPIYDVIYKQISAIKFQKVQKQKNRTQFLKKIENKLLVLISTSTQGKFKKFKEYFRNDLKQTLKLLYVQIYCFLAEKFNFNINEFYSQAFSITLQHHKAGNKKVKGQ